MLMRARARTNVLGGVMIEDFERQPMSTEYHIGWLDGKQDFEDGIQYMLGLNSLKCTLEYLKGYEDGWNRRAENDEGI
jgi:hypothetical protein